jgi:hypothetical protein
VGVRPAGSGKWRERLRGRKPRRARAPAGSNPSGSAKGYGFHGGIKPSERRFKAEKVLEGSARAERGPERVPGSPWRRNALKGEAQECRGLKEASRGTGADTAERVAKPCGRDFRGAGQRSVDASKGVKRRVPGLGNAEGRGSSSEALSGVVSGRPRTRLAAGLEGERRFRWRRSAERSLLLWEHRSGRREPKTLGPTEKGTAEGEEGSHDLPRVSAEDL